MNEEAFYDIMNAVGHLRRAFVRRNMSPPVSIEIGSIEDSYAFRCYMPKDMVLAQPRMNDKDPEWVCNIQGVEIRMPAQWRSELGGGRRLV